MANQKATTKIFIDKYHPKAKGLCAISIRITYERKKKYFPTPISLTVLDFEKTKGDKPRKKIKETALKLQSYEKKAADIIDNLPFFTWETFEKLYLTNRAAKNMLEAAFANYIQELNEAGRIGTAVSYECAQKSLAKFYPNAKFADVTSDFLHKYEKWMLSKGKSITTVGIYLRQLRTLFNIVISEGVLNKEFYPFGKRKYEIPTGKNVKKALTLKDIEKIYYHEPKTDNAKRAKGYWLFMYLCNGINVKDMCLLKYENIVDGVLTFQRAKTAKTKRTVEPIRIVLSDDASQIIRNLGNTKKDGSTYVFPILKPDLSPVRERQLIQQITGVINDHMRKMGDNLEIANPVTTYVARHSFATILKRSGASTEFIGDCIGNSNVKTTQNYLGSFEDEGKIEIMKALTAFKKRPLNKKTSNVLIKPTNRIRKVV